MVGDVSAAPPTVYAIAKRGGAGPRMLRWAKAYGAELRRAWRECPDAHWLLQLARGAGVSQRRLDTALLKWYDARPFERGAEAAAVRKAIRWSIVAKAAGVTP